MKTLRYYIITIFATSLVVVNNPVFADDSTSYGGLTGYRQAYFQGNHGSYPIWYKLTNGTVVGTPLDLPAKALLFEINTTSNGQLTVELPRAIIDSKNGSDDVPYFVSVYDIKSLGGPMKISPEEINNDDIRILKINFTKDITEIEIVGTFFVEKYHYAAPNSMSSLSPLKQYESGLAAKDVKCNSGSWLVTKAKDGSPACVKLDVAYMLIKRGWATSESAYPGGDAQFALDTNSTIIPAHLPRSSGLRIPYSESSQVTNYSGFDGAYNETFPYRGMQKDYVLKPGSTGIITFKIEAVASEQQGQDYPIPLSKSLNLTNYAVFYHEITSLEDLSKYPGVTFNGEGYGDFRACSIGPAGGGACIGGQFVGTNPIEAFVTDHPGVDVLFEPPSEVLPLGMNATSQIVTMMITVDSNAPRGTYLVQLPSSGLDSFLLTVVDQPYHE